MAKKFQIQVKSIFGGFIDEPTECHAELDSALGVMFKAVDAGRDPESIQVAEIVGGKIVHIHTCN